MCGIFGILNLNHKTININELTVSTKLLRHRGPDDEGYFLCNTETKESGLFSHSDSTAEVKGRFPYLENSIRANLGFGFRRLAILDLSSAGHQPMAFEEGGLVIVYNGEIYNYIELRDELRELGYNFRSNSDTEVILKAYHKWGDNCVCRFNGMWAFSIWDMNNETLFCSRDRFGVKPFYYTFISNQRFAFASEIKALLEIVPPQMCDSAVKDYFLLGTNDHKDLTFFSGILQLPAGHNIQITKGEIRIEKYYTLLQKKFKGSFEESRLLVRELLFDSIKIRQRSDVKFGYSLSGGLDSSAIVCSANFLNKGSSHNCFSMIHPGYSVDESRFIDMVKGGLKLNHFYSTPSGEGFLDDFSDFVMTQEEPFGGLSFYGSYKLLQLVHDSGVIVNLEGQGADEIFAGYPTSFPYYLADILKKGEIKRFFQDKKALNIQSSITFQSILNLIISNQDVVPSEKFFKHKFPYLNSEYFRLPMNYLNKMPKFDSGSLLNDELFNSLAVSSVPALIRRADKNSMRHSVECRYPFLDFRLVEFALSLPPEYKIKNGYSKYVLREAVKDIIPNGIYQRRDKIGFAVPYGKWFSDQFKREIFNYMKDIGNNYPYFIDGKQFENLYFDQKNQTVLNLDWKFWKVFSFMVWYDKFIVNQSRHIK